MGLFEQFNPVVSSGFVSAKRYRELDEDADRYHKALMKSEGENYELSKRLGDLKKQVQDYFQPELVRLEADNATLRQQVAGDAVRIAQLNAQVDAAGDEDDQEVEDLLDHLVEAAFDDLLEDQMDGLEERVAFLEAENAALVRSTDILIAAVGRLADELASRREPKPLVVGKGQ